ncbi:hypothetical protein D3C76_1747400 [compost metagenome]
MDLLLTNEEVRKRIGENAKKWAAQHWSLNQMVDRFIAVYEYAIRKRRGGANK